MSAVPTAGDRGSAAPSSRVRSILFAIIGFLVITILAMIVIFEFDSLPLVLSVRRLPGIKHLRRSVYRPLRAAARRYLRW